MEGHPYSSRYARLVALFAVTALGLLMALTLQLKEASDTTAAVVRKPSWLTDYRSRPSCYVRAAMHGQQRILIQECPHR